MPKCQRREDTTPSCYQCDEDAVAIYEGTAPTGRVVQNPACEDHAPELPVVERFDGGGDAGSDCDAGAETDGLDRFDAGDKISVSTRATPMEVSKVKTDTDWVGRRVEIIAENGHGRYSITESVDGELTFRVSKPGHWGRSWKPESTTDPVEVEYAD
jgi:hypothetical protein